MTPRIQYVFLELPNALSRALTLEASVLDNICYALHEMEHLTERPVELKQEIFKLLFNSAELSNFTADERAKYQLDMTTARDIQNQIVYAEDKGMEKGAYKERLLIARNLLKAGVSIEIVVQSTGLDPEVVREMLEGCQ